MIFFIFFYLLLGKYCQILRIKQRMKKLKEYISAQNSTQTWGHSNGWSTNPHSKISPEYIKNSNEYDNYKGYRFFTEDWGDNEHLISMVLEDRPFIIGNIKLEDVPMSEYTQDALHEVLPLFHSTQNNVYTVSLSQLHDNFKGKGLGSLLYEYTIKKYSIVISDTTLFSESYNLWTKTLPERLSGPVFGYYYKMATDSKSLQLVSNMMKGEEVSRFMAFSSRNKVDDKIFKVCNHIKSSSMSFKEATWLLAKKGKTETLKAIRNDDYNNTGIFEEVFAQNIFSLNKIIIIVGKNYYISVYKDQNNKIKVIDF